MLIMKNAESTNASIDWSLLLVKIVAVIYAQNNCILNYVYSKKIIIHLLKKVTNCEASLIIDTPLKWLCLYLSGVVYSCN